MRLTSMRFRPDEPAPKKTPAPPPPKKKKRRAWPFVAGGAFVFVLAAVLLFTGPFSSIFGKKPLPTGTPYVFATLPPLQQEPNGRYTLHSYAKGENFYFKQQGQWNAQFLKGVNIGLSLPDTDLNNPGADYLTYYNWLASIAAMNANSVRVFTVMPPAFYNALYAYNSTHPETPLFFFQGIWVNEGLAAEREDMFSGTPSLLESFVRGVREGVDIVHGNSNYTDYGKISPAVYETDVSPWLAGYILGLEWNPEWIKKTNQNNPGKTAYSGTYLSTDGGAFLAFLCEAGNALIAHETQNYGAQAPVGFLNWSTTDVLTHSAEPFAEEDAVSLDTREIKATGAYYAGLFAPVDAYPYYPEFLNHQPEYVNYKDEANRQNPYRAYLNDLQAAYDVPVLIAEYGVSSARGRAHESLMGYHQGGLTETQQGEANAAMLLDIALSKCAGGLLFSWQDEWFKQTWNTARYGAEVPAARGYNAQSAEQGYGLVGFTPAREGLTFPDGDDAEWAGAPLLQQTGSISLYARADEGYLHLFIRYTGVKITDRRLVVALGLTGRGSHTSRDLALQFSRAADFILILDKQEATLLTDAYYDRFYYEYGVNKGVLPREPQAEVPRAGKYNPIYQFLSNPFTLPLTGEEVAAKYYEAGVLARGNANPASTEYNSLADWNAGEDFIELRIPWALLNVVDPSQKTMLANFYKNPGETERFDSIYIGVADAYMGNRVEMESFSYSPWQQSLYVMRYKQSYYIMQKAMKEIMP